MFRRRTDDRTLDCIQYAHYVSCRETADREASPTVAIIDSQNVKGAKTGGVSIDRHGYDLGKKIKGKKRHVLVDTLGLLTQAAVLAAGVQDRDGGVSLMETLFELYPFLLKLDADAGYQGQRFQDEPVRVSRQVNFEIVKRSETGRFVVLPKRWIVERTIG